MSDSCNPMDCSPYWRWILYWLSYQYSKVVQLYMYIYLFFSRFFSNVGYYRILSRITCAIQKVLADYIYISQCSRSVVSDSLQPHESQHARPPCPSPTPWVHSDSCPSSQWCHPAISSSAVPFSSCPQSLPASESFLMSQLFAWGGQSTGVSALASFLPKQSQGWSPSEWTGWISLQPKGL